MVEERQCLIANKRAIAHGGDSVTACMQFKPLDLGNIDGSEYSGEPVKADSLSHYLEGPIHPRWLAGFVSSNRSTTGFVAPVSMDFWSSSSRRWENSSMY